MKKIAIYYVKEYAHYFEANNSDHARMLFYDARREDIRNETIKVFEVNKVYNCYKVTYGVKKEIEISDIERIPKETIDSLIRGRLIFTSIKEVPSFRTP